VGAVGYQKVKVVQRKAGSACEIMVRTVLQFWVASQLVRTEVPSGERIHSQQECRRVKPSTDAASSSINRTCTWGSNFTNLVSMDPVEGAFWIISTALDALAYVVDGLVARFFPHGAASIEAPRARRRPRRRKPFYWKHPSLRF